MGIYSRVGARNLNRADHCFGQVPHTEQKTRGGGGVWGRGSKFGAG